MDLKLCKKLLSWFPNDYLYNNNISATYNKIHNYDKAIYHATKSIKLFKNYENPFNHLGKACMQL